MIATTEEILAFIQLNHSSYSLLSLFCALISLLCTLISVTGSGHIKYTKRRLAYKIKAAFMKHEE